MANLEKVVKLTKSQLDTLNGGGTVGSITGISDNYLYAVPIDDASIQYTYAQLKTLRDGGKLTPGQWYRITDYVCTTTTTNTSSAGHVFDVIVRADTTNTLNENAFAAKHANDTYFTNNNLAAWQLKYCLDNDTAKFAWADATNGKGVIYWMQDEFNNECPYDFKNILFTYSRYTNVYTFAYYDSSTITDASLNAASYATNASGAKSNIIKPKYENVSGQTSRQSLNFNIFYATTTTKGIFNNTLDCGCYENLLLGCSGIRFGPNCFGNTLQTGCKDITFVNKCYFNTIGLYSSSIILNSYCVRITIANYSKKITVGNGCVYLTITSDDTGASLHNQLQNVLVHTGVAGTSSTSLTLSAPDRALDYETEFKKDNSVTILV